MNRVQAALIFLLLAVITVSGEEVNTRQILNFKSANNVDVTVTANESNMVSITFNSTYAVFNLTDLKQLEGLLKIHLEIVDAVVKEKMPYIFNRDAGRILATIPEDSLLRFIFKTGGKATEEDCSIVLDVIPYGKAGAGSQTQIVFSPQQVRDLLGAFNDSYETIAARKDHLAKVLSLTDKANAY